MKSLKVTIALIAALICNLSLSATNKFAYHTESNESGNTTQIVYKMDESGKYLTPHLKYNISYNAQERMEQKEVLRWDSNSRQWINQYTLSFEYNTDTYSIACARWNETNNEYSDIYLKTTYNLNKDNQTYRYETFRRDDRSKEWVMTQSNEFTENPPLYANN